MDWTMIDPIGTFFCLGDIVDGVFVPADDCDEVLDDMLEALLSESSNTFEVRRRMAIDKVVEKDIIPLLKDCPDKEVFAKAVRLMVNLTQPSDMCIQPPMSTSEMVNNEVASLISSAKHQCTDVDFLKAIASKMKELLAKEKMDVPSCQCLNYCLLLLRNLFHIRPNSTPNSQATIAHQCLVSSFFINELDQVILAMLNHKLKETWTIGLSQLISFLFKDYSASLLEPDIDDNTSASSGDEPQEVVEILTPEADRNAGSSGADQNLSSSFKNKLQLCSACENGSRSSEDDDFVLEFKSTEDGKLEIKLTNCPQRIEPSGGSGEDMDTGENGNKGSPGSAGSKGSGKNLGGSNSSLNSNDKEADAKAEEQGYQSTASEEEELLSSLNSSSCLMDMDILVSYLKKFASDIMCSGFVDLVENIMKALLTKYDSVLDHSFLMWTVGFFLSFAHQQDLDFCHFKKVLNLDLFGFLVYEGVLCCEALQVKHKLSQDCSVEKHRLHLVACTLNQMFRALLTNSKMDYLQNLLKCLSLVTQLRDLFVLLIRYYLSSEQTAVYLRDLVQTNHVLMLMVEEWLAHGYLGEHCGFSMLEHVKQFATKTMMTKYGSLLEHQELNRETLNVAVLTMMYHVAGDCKRQDTLMQLPILKSFYEIWVENAIKEDDEFKDLIEFVLEFFMSNAEQDPNTCAQNLLDSPDLDGGGDGHERNSGSGGSGTDGSRSGESAMNVSSSSGEEFGDEEQALIFSWAADLEGSSNMADRIHQRLQEHGFTKTKEQVTKFLTVNGFIEELSSSSSTSSLSSSSRSGQNEESPVHEGSDLLSELSAMPEDNIIPFLLDKLRGQGFESQLVWLQKQLLETAYVKLAIKDSAYRIYVEEPVPKFFALQNKSVPIVPWNEELESALATPGFRALQESLGLLTADDPAVLFARIPQYMSPSMLVGKARQIGPIDSLTLKFNVDALKDSSDFDIGQEEPAPVTTHSGQTCRPSRPLNHQWLNFVLKKNNNTPSTKVGGD
ncbi:protein timeless [Aplysia californica]|uniref:Protein timeless n=1 Tax=Aplysia californica TaxID=6500 RepID=A0ABM1AAH9_APLCA|nr:protein timeless [Aplysia californica]